MRTRLAQHGFGADRGFRWRGGEASLQTVNGRLMRTRIRRAAASGQEPAAS